MIDFNSEAHAVSTVNVLRDKIAELQIERDEARVQRDQAVAAERKLRDSLQYALKEWAEANLDTSDDSYADLHEVMVDNGLDGLKRTFTARVRVTFEFEVEVEAADEDEARDAVDNEITTHIHENVSLYDYPDEHEIEVEEA